MDAISSGTFPDSTIDPFLKGEDYIMQYVKAAWGAAGNLLPTSLYFGNVRMEEIRTYAMGKQPINKYKNILTGTEAEDSTWMDIDWEVVPLIPKFREIAISTMMKAMYDPSIFAVDELSRTEQDDYINILRAKLIMLDQLQQQGSNLSDSQILKLTSNEPRDLEQLEIETQFGFKHNLATECEEALQVIQQKNKSDYKRRKVFENLYDYGIAGYMTDIDDGGNVIYKDLQPAKMILSYCEEPDFSDAEYIGHVDMVSIADLSPYFDAETLQTIIKSVAGKFNNPIWSSTMGTNLSLFYDKFHVQVLNIRFIDYDIKVWKETKDSGDNVRFGKTDFKNIDKVGKDVDGKPRFLKQTSKVVRKCKWIIDTDLMYDYGLMENMNRKKSSWFETDLGACIMAWNFNKMQFGGIVERLMPIADTYMLTWYKLQSITNQLIPYLIHVDFDALESVPFGKSGEKMKPKDIMQLIYQKFIVISRGSDISGKTNGNKVVDIVASGQLEAFGQLYNDLNQKYLLMQQISGFNAATDGSTINSKTLNGATEAMQLATNSALFMIIDSERKLFFNLCDNIIQKLQIAISLGKVEGYTMALGSSGVKMLQLSEDIPLREFGLFLEEAPTQEEWTEFLKDIDKYDQAGLLEPQDKILLRSYRNLKKAYMILSYLIKKRKQEQQSSAMQLQQANAQVQQQSAQVAEQAKQQTIALQHDLKMQEINAEGEWTFKTTGLKNEGALNAAQISAQAKVTAQQIIEDNKGKIKTADAVMNERQMQHDLHLQSIENQNKKDSETENPD